MSTSVIPSCGQLSPTLEAMLDSMGYQSGMKISRPDLLRMEISAAIDDADAMLSGAGEDVARRLFRELSATYVMVTPKMSDAEARMVEAAYTMDLAEQPEFALRYAIARARRTCRFFPTIAELYTLCREATRDLRIRRCRLRMLQRAM